MNAPKPIKVIWDKFFAIKFFRYCFCGGIAAITDLALFYVLNEWAKLYYLFALPISFTAAALVNYSLQRKVTFNNAYSKKHKQFAVFFLVEVIGLLLNGFFTAIQVEFFGVWPTLARFISIWIVLIYNYTANKKITFKLMK